MKKICYVLVCVILLSLCPCVMAAVETPEQDAAQRINFVLDDFSQENITAEISSRATVTRVIDGVGTAEGAAHIRVEKEYASLSYPFGAKAGQTYDISCWIKMDETPKLDQVQFVIYNFDAETGKKMLYNMVTVSKAGLTKDKWVKVSATYVGQTTGREAGVGNFPVTDKGNLHIRIGDGRSENTMHSGNIAYTIDDICVIPRKSEKQVITEDNLLPNGNFEAENYMENWTSGGSNTALEEIAGANGTASAMKIGVLNNWGTAIQHDVDMRFGRKYKISFWAKATSTEAEGKEIYFILSRTVGGGKVDLQIPNYEYIYPKSDRKLGAEWKYYEMEYYNTLCTDDPIKPSFMFRVGNGTELLSYAIDEVQIHEIPTTGHLQSAGQFSGSPQNGSVYGYTCTTSGLARNCVTRVLEPFQDDYAIIKSATATANEISISMRGDEEYENIKFVAVSIDYDGNVGEEYVQFCSAPELPAVTTAEFNETVWNDEIPSLTARVSYRKDEIRGALFAAVAYYASNGQLLSVYEDALHIAEDGGGTHEFSVPNNTDAVKAKLFLWESVGTKPVQTAAQIEKITDARFIYIDPEKGANNLTANYQKPLKSLFQARTLLKREIQKATKDIYLIFMPGTYDITSTQELTTADCNENVQVIFTSYNKNNKAEFTGGKNISGTFMLYDSNKNIYRAKVDAGTQSRQLFVNGVRAVKAKNNGPLSDAVNIKQDNATGNMVTAAEAKKIVDAGGSVKDIGIQTSDTFLKDYKRVDDIELVFYEQWTNPRCQVASITDNGNGTILLRMDAVGWSAMSNKGGTATTVPVYIENAIELLDEEGEWYLDSVEGYVYYKPRFFENMQTADVVLPITEKLFTLTGTNVDTPIKNISFDHIEFTETTWMRPSTENGHSDAQNNHIRQNGDKLCDAAVEVQNGHNINFTNCDFNRLGITALKMTGAIQNCDVVGNEFCEISGSAINLGDVVGENVIRPPEEKYYITENNITDNYIHNFGVEFKSAAGISAGFPKNTNISHNEIYCGAYSGMHIGYGWATHEEKGTATENLHIKNNYIHNVLNDNIYDGGGIYTIGMTNGTRENPNLICENYFEDIGNMHGAMYTDEGSAFWKLSKNVIDMSMNLVWPGKLGSHKSTPIWLHIWTSSIHDIILEDNYSTTQAYRNAGTNIDFENAILPEVSGWQPEAKEIIANAGVTAPYKQNFKAGFQRAEVVQKIVLKAGETIMNKPMCLTGKNVPYPTQNIEIYRKSANPAVAEVDGNTISAKAKGETVITYYFIENGVLKTAQTRVIVE